jgi:hypothetical protein
VLLEVLLFFVVVLLVLTSVELHRGSRPPFLLLGGSPILYTVDGQGEMRLQEEEECEGDCAWRKKKSVRGAALGERDRHFSWRKKIVLAVCGEPRGGRPGSLDEP